MTCVSKSVSRLELLRGRFRGVSGPQRPPWAIPEALFLNSCERCAACREACPEHILVEGSGGYPAVAFAQGGCTFCEACVTACPSGALDLFASDTKGERRAPWFLTAQISKECLSRRGVTCRICGEHCESGAISFRLHRNGVATPRVEDSACTGCGACVGPCPVAAIDMRPAPEARPIP